MSQEQKKCSKVCWELLELTEKQEEIIKRLTLKIKELEALQSASIEQYS